MKRPGARLHALASRCCSSRTMEQVIGPTVADFQAEYRAAETRGAWRRRATLLRGYFSCARVFVRLSAATVLRGSAGWPVDKRRDWTRLLWSALAAFFVSMTCLVAVPLAQQRWFYTMAPGAGKALSMTTLLLPQAVPIALPLCVLIGATFGLTGGDRTRVPQGATLLLGVVLSAASFATAVWVLPEANQAFRVLVMGPHVRPGLPELSQAALRQFLDEPADVTMRILSASSAAAAWVYYVRYALSIAPLVLAMFALSLLATRRAGRIARIVAAFVAVAVYYGCLWTARPLVLDGTVPAFAAVWFPNVALGIVSLVLFAVPPPGNATCRDARISS